MIIDWLLNTIPEPSPLDSLDAWWKLHCAVARRFNSPIDIAIAAGFSADRVAYAFGSGYVAAGAAMFPPLSAPTRSALCATEEGGAHPRSIQTKLRPHLDHYLINGNKRFVTFGTDAELLYVVASEGTGPDGRNKLRIAAITPRGGITIEPLTVTSFVPEIPHAAITFSDVIVEHDELLDGDGYSTYLKPFRTVEDCHVHGALLGYLIAVARRFEWRKGDIERLLSLVCSIRTITLADPTSPATHVALGGLLQQSHTLRESLEPAWGKSDELTRLRWQRDKALLGVAGSAREKRLKAAWRQLDL